MPVNAFEPNPASPFFSWHVEHAGLRVTDFHAAVAWYQEKLDFQLLRSWQMGDRTFGFIAPAGWREFTLEVIGGGNITDVPQPPKDLPSTHTKAGLHHLCFRVESVDNTIAALKHREVTVIMEPRDNPEIAIRFAFFIDPWGNLFEVLQTTEP